MIADTPLLTTLRLILPPFDPARHFNAAYLGWLNDKTLMRYSEQRHAPHDITDCAEYFATAAHMWAILDWNERMIGTAACDIDAPNDSADIGIMLGARRGDGLGREAWDAVLTFARRRYRRVAAGCMETNEPMKHILEATMMFDYRVKDRFLVEGRAVDAVYYRG